MAIKKNSYEKLSEQEVIECVMYANVFPGCNGGFASMVFNHSKVSLGVAAAISDPYVGSTKGRKCNLNRPRASNSAVVSWGVVPNKENDIKEALYNIGPLHITLYASSDLYSYKSGVYTDDKKRCGSNNPNHSVLLVGYGTLNGVDYWLLKNSWGPNWGDNGYFKLKRGVKLCKINVGATYPRLA